MAESNTTSLNTYSKRLNDFIEEANMKGLDVGTFLKWFNNITFIVTKETKEAQHIVEKTKNEGAFLGDKDIRLEELKEECKKSLSKTYKDKEDSLLDDVHVFIETLKEYFFSENVEKKADKEFIEFVAFKLYEKNIEFNNYEHISEVFRCFIIIRLLNKANERIKKPLNTAELFNMDLTTFFEEVKQDFMYAKYGRLLAECQIVNLDLENYLKKMTNDFNDAIMAYADIPVWELRMKFAENLDPSNLPIVCTIKEILLQKIEDKMWSKTMENLKKDSDFIIMDFERPDSFADITDETSIAIISSQCKGYQRAKDLQQYQDKTKAETEHLTTTHDKPQYNHSKLLENYKFWYKHSEETGTETQGYLNIFKGISETQFFEMIDNADFSMIVHKHGYSKRVRLNIFVLSKILGVEWGEKAAKKINSTLEKCSKNSGFHESEALKNLYLQ